MRKRRGNLPGLSVYQHPLLSPVSGLGFPEALLCRGPEVPHTPLRSAPRFALGDP